MPPRSLLAFLVLVFTLSAAPAARAGTFDRDTTWAHLGLAASPADGSTRWSALAMLADGRFLAAGRTPAGQAAVARFTADGELDTTWAGDQPTPGLLVVAAQAGVTPASLVVLSDGKVLLGGTTLAVDFTPSLVIARLTADGHLDPTFATGGKLVTTSGPESELSGLAVTGDGHILVSATSSGSGTDRGLLVRLTAGGVRDAGFGTGGEVAFRLGGAGTTFFDVALDGAGRIYLTGARATTPRHQLFVARLTTAGVLDPAYGAGAAGYAVTDLNGASATVYEVEGRRLRVDAGGTALAVATVKSATGAATHLVGLARFTSAGVLDASFGTAGTRTQDVSPSHIFDAAALVSLPDGGFVVGGGTGVGANTQFGLAGYHADGSPDTTLNPANATAANAANLQVGTGGVDRIFALARTPQGRLIAAGESQDPSEHDLSAIVRLGGDAHSPQANVAVTWEQAVPGRAVRPGQTVGFDGSASSDPDGPIVKYEWDLDGDGSFERTGAKVLGSYPGPTIAGVLLRVTDADGLMHTSGATVVVEADKVPTAAFINPSKVPVAGAPFTFGVQAADADGSIVAYDFDLDGNGTYESPGTLPLATTTFGQKGPASVGVRVTDDEGATATATYGVTVKDAPCVDNPTIKIERAVIITQGADVAGGAGCFHGVTTDKAGVKTTVWTTSGHFRVNGLEVDTLAATEAKLEWKRKGDDTQSLKLVAPKVRVEGTAKQTDFMFHEGAISWDLSGSTIGGFVVDPNAGVGGLALKVVGAPAISADGKSALDVLPGMPPELLGKTPSAPDHLVFGPAANAAALGAFSFHVDQIPLGVILLGPVTVSYDGAGSWMIAAEATIPYPIPTKVKGHLVIVAGHVKEVDLELQGALPTPTPVVINALGLHIDFGPKVAAKPDCIKTVGLVETTPYDIYKALDYYIPVLRQLATAHPELYGSLFHKTFQNYPVPTFALCGHIELSLAEVLDADVGFGFARYSNPYPNLFFFHGQATIAKVINAEVNAEFTTEGYVHFNAAVKGGYPTASPWVKWDIGLDFEYFKKQFNAEAHAVIEIPPLDFTTGANILVSNKGLAACLYFKTFAGTWRPGAGAMWGHGPTLYFFGCDVKDYKVVIKHALSGDTVIGDIVPPSGAKAATAGMPVVDAVPSGGHGNSAGLLRVAGAKASAAAVAKAAQSGGPDPVDIPAGLPGTVMAFKGADAPPHVIIHGPSGQVFDTGTGNAPAEAPGFAALKNASLGITEVVIEKPAGGRWTVEPAADSSRLVQGIQADGTRPVTATAKVTGSAHDRRLAYTVKGLPAGSRVDFAEAGNGGGGLIGSVKADGSGTLRFHPAGGAPGKREIQGVVYAADGYLTSRLTLGTYTAPAPQRPARATKLTVRRVGKKLVLRWRGSKSAYTQQIDIRSAAGLNLTRTVRRSTTSIALPAAGTKLVVNVTGTTRSGLAGTVARFNARVPKAAKKRRTKG
ncbi:PKD domain-containing protein [Solirubrobacter ginsenosidimutans]|uniref:PKD domain-containing protein n=1 Tax=Solirubrobacter ginsenosidimutans TaxID=490573 RepID=A0A9X3S6K8_9ACTN|nr:PKD domain-containing protein [Solirubrobacter ginsenosidimutans]MDA0165226.1 PKD domain-containing protein [Solirubrobacter ginsenosidimutans]